MKELLGGLLLLVSFVAFALGVFVLIRGHLDWLRLRSRPRALAVIGAALVGVFVAGTLLPAPPPTVRAERATAATTTPEATAPTTTTVPETTTTAAPTPTTTTAQPTTTTGLTSAPPSPTRPPETTTTGAVAVAPMPQPVTYGRGDRDPFLVPIPVTDNTGASATFTLNNVRYAPVSGSGQTGELVIVDITVTGTSSAPYKFSESALVMYYLNDSNESDPAYSHQYDRLAFGPNHTEDYTPFLPPQPLRVGSVTAGQSKRGLVILRPGSVQHPYILFVASSGDSGGPADRQAQWVLP